MRTVGLITEYNPFHKGHRYHIAEAKRMSQATHVIVIMSGNYVQRGIPAFLDKYDRAGIALRNGADLVVELPSVFATASAEIFAGGAVSLLDRIGITDCICFGTEGAGIHELQRIASILTEEPESFREVLKENLRMGESFPSARTTALLASLPDCDRDKLEKILNLPNNILGIEYLKALISRKSRIEPLCISRIHSGYHDTSFESRFFSASAIRSIDDPDTLLGTLEDIDSVYREHFDISYPVETKDFDVILGSRLLSACASSRLTDIADVSGDMENAIRKNLYSYTGYDDFASLLKSKNITYSRISRCLLHIMLGIPGNLVTQALGQNRPNYVRVLGFTERGKELLGRIHPEITVITKTAGWERILTDSLDKKIFEENLRGDELYRMVVMNKFKRVIPNEFTRKMIVTK